MVTFAQTVISD